MAADEVTFNTSVKDFQNFVASGDGYHVAAIAPSARLCQLVVCRASFMARRLGVRLKVKTTAFVANRRLIEALERCSRPILCGDDCILFRQGDTPRGIYLLRRGEATLTMMSNKGEVLLQLRATAGSLLGLPGVIGHEPYTLTARVRRSSEVSFISKAAFDELLRSDPQLSLGVCEVLAAEVRSARQAISDL